jgi:hypothetical protein
VLAVNSSGPVDLKSKWGGVFFYGIHQVDAVIELMGTDVKRVSLQRSGENGIATIFFRDGAVATINCIKSGGRFHWQACCEKGVVTQADARDPSPYLSSAKLIRDLIGKGKQPFSRERMLAPVAVLEAMQKSLNTGKPVSVAKL